MFKISKFNKQKLLVCNICITFVKLIRNGARRPLNPIEAKK